MIYLSKDDAWPKTWVKRDPFGPEEQVDKLFRDVFYEGVHIFAAKHGDSPSHMLLGKREIDKMRNDINTLMMSKIYDPSGTDKLDRYCGVEFIFSPHSGMEFLGG